MMRAVCRIETVNIQLMVARPATRASLALKPTAARRRRRRGAGINDGEGDEIEVKSEAWYE